VLSEAREQTGLSQRVVAARARVSPSALSRGVREATHPS
jgi:transcriptional regulator with XRE-family HTH domain